MATFLDLGLLEHFGVIFPLILVFVIVFALLEKSKLLGDNKGIHSLVALSIAIMMLFVPGVVKVFAIMAPWFVLIMMLILFFMITLIFLGVKTEKIVAYVSGDWYALHWFLLAIALIIFIGALASVYGGSMLPYSGGETGNMSAAAGGTTGVGTDTGDFNANVGRVIFHPKTIGLVFILLLGSLTIRLLAAKPE